MHPNAVGPHSGLGRAKSTKLRTSGELGCVGHPNHKTPEQQAGRGEEQKRAPLSLGGGNRSPQPLSGDRCRAGWARGGAAPLCRAPGRAVRGRAGPPGRRRQAGTSPPLSPPEASGARHWASCGRCPPQRIPHSPARHGTAPALRPHPRRAPHGESQPWVSGEVLLWGEVSQTREGAFWGGKGPPESSAPHSCPARILHGGASSRAVRGSQGFLLPSPLAFGGPPRVKQCRGFVEGMGGKAADLGPPGSAVPSDRCLSVGPYGHSGAGTASGFNGEKKGEGKNIYNLIAQSKEAARIPLVATWSN